MLVLCSSIAGMVAKGYASKSWHEFDDPEERAPASRDAYLRNN
jgi:hypothetical protein